MADKPDNHTNFWEELKRRKVVRVITVYAAASFVLLELVDIVAPSLGLPAWTLNLVIVLLSVGFPISIILSWVFDLTPEGLKKTESSKAIKLKESVRLLLIESMAVRIPTSAIIPNAMIKTVRMVRNKFVRIALSAILMFSKKRLFDIDAVSQYYFIKIINSEQS